MPVKRNFNASSFGVFGKIVLWSVLVFIIIAACIVAIIFYSERYLALHEAEEKALIILHKNLAVHAYFAKQLKPSVFKLVSAHDATYFDPVWMSSTYAIREIHSTLSQNIQKEYYYKECAINARSPLNEADEFEKKFLTGLNQTTALQKQSGVRMIDGKPFFYVLLRGEKMEQPCLMCHSVPEKAPKGLVAQYGGERSFGRYLDETVSAISIRVPLATAFENANRNAIRLSAMLVLLLVVMLAAFLHLTRIYIFEPLKNVRDEASLITTDPRNLGKQITGDFGREMGDMINAFNSMSLSLKDTIDGLDEAVRARTGELVVLNAQLSDDIEKRKVIEQEKEHLIQKLQEALQHVKTLQGFIPICASCKKIRDDKGYWNVIEQYISSHTDAEFSHGICPDCAEKLYGDYIHKDEKPR